MRATVIHTGARNFSGLLLDTFGGRLRGWLGRRPGVRLQAIVLTGCRQVHFWGPLPALEVLFVDGEGRVCKQHRAEPWSLPAGHPDAVAVVEIAARFVPRGFSPEHVAWRS